MIKNKSKKVWVCDCGRKVVAKKMPTICPACGRTDTFASAPQIVTK